ncbi:SDR family NAD(P)-dependent oxidoreductase [Sphingobium sp. EP60837]|uniref:SDR family NAD(P)-dependent oxidoreductase n=1 Tax=Sphingobium sp. EP60837 TaxID=1855519 RepID=UPI0007DCCAE4|nr:SDR family oxidoreductase [Sphingobium sp. EP60837]ANI80175.1 Rhamnolipids biosynthesis 3-oxoacyl-(acyl-carrier-protein) reductase [Sphingobium sp. EP60837]
MARIAVITGGTSGLGKRVIERLLDDDWHVWSLSRSEKRLEEQQAALNAGDRLRYAPCDVGDHESVSNVFALIRSQTNQIDALICSAGINIQGSLEDMTPQQANDLIGTNLLGPWLCVREALPLLRENADVSNPKRVVIIGSIGGMRPKVGAGIYSATKAAAHILSQVFAVELASSGIVVNVVAPGSTNTPMLAEAQQAVGNSAYRPSGASPLGRIAEPDDIVDVVQFFLSDAAKFVNGAILPVDGGTRAAYMKT